MVYILLFCFRSARHNTAVWRTDIQTDGPVAMHSVFFFLVANSEQSVAVLTTWCQVSLSLAFFHAVWTPKFRGCTSSSIVLSQVVRGRPTGLLQSVGGLRAAAMTRWWSSSGAERARCPKNLRQKDFTLSETGKHPVILRTVSLVVCLVYGIRRIFRKHQVSKDGCWRLGAKNCAYKIVGHEKQEQNLPTEDSRVKNCKISVDGSAVKILTQLVVVMENWQKDCLSSILGGLPATGCCQHLMSSLVFSIAQPDWYTTLVLHLTDNRRLQFI